MEVDVATLRKARRFARREFNRLSESWEYQNSHASHAASKALELAAERYGFGYGVEGFCDELGRCGAQYVNAGDSYDLTLCCKADRYRAHFFIASFAWLAGDRF